jgi:hypothetical protein
MVRKKLLALVGVILFCLAISLILSCQTGLVNAQDPQIAKGFDKQIQEALEQGAMVFVAYSKTNGEPFAIIESPGFEVVWEGGKEGDEGVPKDRIDGGLPKNLLKVLKHLEETKRRNIIETQATPSYYVHGSPGCSIMVTASGRYKVVCPK